MAPPDITDIAPAPLNSDEAGWNQLWRNHPWGVLLIGAASLVPAAAVLKPFGHKALRATRRRLKSLGLTPHVLSLSLALGFVLGLQPLYVPVLPFFVVAALARYLEYSSVASVLGFNLATPLMLMMDVPYIMAGSELCRLDLPDLDALDQMLSSGDLRNLVSTFGTYLIAGELAWALTSPIAFAVGYYSFLVLTRALLSSSYDVDDDGMEYGLLSIDANDSSRELGYIELVR
jgi:hypothetical protein